MFCKKKGIATETKEKKRGERSREKETLRKIPSDTIRVVTAIIINNNNNNNKCMGNYCYNVKSLLSLPVYAAAAAAAENYFFQSRFQEENSAS